MTEPVARLTPAEWQRIAAVLPPGKPARHRHDDQDIITAMLFCVAADLSLERVPHGYGIGSWTLRTRQTRWRQSGTWDRILTAAAPAIARMRREIGKDDLLEQCSRVFGWDK